MKKLLFVLIAAVICSAANAQLVTTSDYKVKKSERRTSWMLRAGLTAAGVSGDGAEDLGAMTGYNVSFEFNKAFATNFYWGMGLLLGSKGYKYDEDGYELKLAANKLEIPLNFGYKYPLTDKIKLDGHVGAYMNYDLFGTVSSGDEEIDLSDLDDYNRYGAGLQFGIGVWYNKLNFNITYQKGLVEMAEDSKMYENNWMFSLGYAF